MYTRISSCFGRRRKSSGLYGRAGYYKVSLDTQPSLMNGTLGKAVKESLGRIRFGGIAPTAQRYIISIFRRSGD